MRLLTCGKDVWIWGEEDKEVGTYCIITSFVVCTVPLCLVLGESGFEFHSVWPIYELLQLLSLICISLVCDWSFGSFGVSNLLNRRSVARFAVSTLVCLKWPVILRLTDCDMLRCRWEKFTHKHIHCKLFDTRTLHLKPNPIHADTTRGHVR
jgi:hypothetical protein